MWAIYEGHAFLPLGMATRKVNFSQGFVLKSFNLTLDSPTSKTDDVEKKFNYYSDKQCTQMPFFWFIHQRSVPSQAFKDATVGPFLSLTSGN